VGSRGEDPIRGLVDEPPKLKLIFGNGCKTDILMEEKSKMHTCLVVYLEERMLQSCQLSS